MSDMIKYGCLVNGSTLILILLAGPPEAPKDCNIPSQTPEYFVVRCELSFLSVWPEKFLNDPSLVYHLKIYDAKKENLIWNIKEFEKPIFKVYTSDLMELPKITSHENDGNNKVHKILEYTLIIFAENRIGKSPLVEMTVSRETQIMLNRLSNSSKGKEREKDGEIPPDKGKVSGAQKL